MHKDEGLNRKCLRKHGFTLIEIMIVIAILTMLAAIAIPQFIKYRSQSIDAQLKADLRNAAIAVESYFAKHSVYPSTIEEVQSFGFHPTDGVTVTLALAANSYTVTATKQGGSQPSLTFSSVNGSIQ